MQTHSRPTVGYALNAFPCESFADWWTCLNTDVLEIKRRIFPDEVFPIELRFSEQFIRELTPDRVAQLKSFFAAHGLALVTVNAFVMPHFHGAPVKERAYLPAWHASDARLNFTNRCVDLLAELKGTSSQVPKCSSAESELGHFGTSALEHFGTPALATPPSVSVPFGASSMAPKSLVPAIISATGGGLCFLSLVFPERIGGEVVILLLLPFKLLFVHGPMPVILLALGLIMGLVLFIIASFLCLLIVMRQWDNRRLGRSAFTMLVVGTVLPISMALLGVLMEGLSGSHGSAGMEFTVFLGTLKFGTMVFGIFLLIPLGLTDLVVALSGTPAGSSSARIRPTATLEELARLRDAGLISNEDYVQKKNDILSRL